MQERSRCGVLVFIQFGEKRTDVKEALQRVQRGRNKCKQIENI